MLITLERFAAYACARDAFTAIARATATWPPDLAAHAKTIASNILAKTAEANDQDPTSPARRKCLRDAIVDALVLASLCDLASSHGLTSDDLNDSLRHASRTISMLGLSFHATSAANDE
ncbi:MAG TPA: hypothetical protein VIV40_42495 [Kofleriaceae bacterium]